MVGKRTFSRIRRNKICFKLGKYPFENNRDIDRLGDYPLIQEEMEDLLEQIRRLRTPLKLDGFINGKTVSITRKNPDDTLHYGKEVSLKIYDRMEIAAGAKSLSDCAATSFCPS